MPFGPLVCVLLYLIFITAFIIKTIFISRCLTARTVVKHVLALTAIGAGVIQWHLESIRQ